MRNEVKIQHWLNVLFNERLAVDGIIGRMSRSAYERNMLEKYVNVETATRNLEVLTRQKGFNFNDLYVVFIDAGHGGIDANGRYTTNGKMYQHKGHKFHLGRDWYYEGYENRLIADRVKSALKRKGIASVFLHDLVQDTPLIHRTSFVNTYLRAGFHGYVHSIHSNAISTKGRTQSELDATRGFIVFTSLGQDFSDKIATVLFNNVKKHVGNGWNYRTDLKDGDVDFEAQFFMLTKYIPNHRTMRFGAILEEFGFHTSLPDTLFITSPRVRDARVNAIVDTAFWVKHNI